MVDWEKELEAFKQELEKIFDRSNRPEMEFPLTNNVLKALSEVVYDSLYSSDMDTIDQEEIDKTIAVKKIEYARDFMLQNPIYKAYYKGLTNDHVKRGVFIFVMNLYLFHFHKSFLKRISDEFALCARILSSDLCRRNSKLRDQVWIEYLKLDAAMNTNPVRLAVNTLYEMFKNAYPEKSKIALCKDVSTAMSVLKIYDRKPFLTEKEAEEWVDEQTIKKNGNYFQTADKVIYDRVKKYLYKSKVIKGK